MDPSAMELYLIQHGEALSESQDPARPLSEKGLADVQKTAALATRLGIRVAEIRHSEKKRAEQTAQILETALGAPRVPAPDLLPNDDINPLRREVASRSESLMIVGHLPFLARLAGSLLAQDESMPVVEFRKAALIFLRRQEDGRWSLCWMVPPEALVS